MVCDAAECDGTAACAGRLERMWLTGGRSRNRPQDDTPRQLEIDEILDLTTSQSRQGARSQGGKTPQQTITTMSSGRELAGTVHSAVAETRSANVFFISADLRVG